MVNGRTKGFFAPRLASLCHLSQSTHHCSGRARKTPIHHKSVTTLAWPQLDSRAGCACWWRSSNSSSWWSDGPQQHRQDDEKRREKAEWSIYYTCMGVACACMVYAKMLWNVVAHSSRRSTRQVDDRPLFALCSLPWAFWRQTCFALFFGAVPTYPSFLHRWWHTQTRQPSEIILLRASDRCSSRLTPKNNSFRFALSRTDFFPREKNNFSIIGIHPLSIVKPSCCGMLLLSFTNWSEELCVIGVFLNSLKRLDISAPPKSRHTLWLEFANRHWGLKGRRRGMAVGGWVRVMLTSSPLFLPSPIFVRDLTS